MALGEARLNPVWPWHKSLINLLGKGDLEPPLLCVWFPNLSLLGTVEQALVFTLAEHETKQPQQVSHCSGECHILTAAQQVLTTAWFASELNILDKHFIMKIRALLSPPSWQTAAESSHLLPGHSNSFKLLPSA